MNRARIVAAATGALGLIGLGLTLFPLVTASASDRMLRLLSNENNFWRYWFDSETVQEYWDYACKEYQRQCPGQGGGTLDANAYDLISSGYALNAIVPLALALAVAVGALSAWRVRDTRVFAFVSLTSVSALAVLAFTAINPAVAVSGTGELGGETGVSEASTSDLDFSIGAGLYLPAAVLTVIFLLNAWQAVVTMLGDREPIPAG